MGPPPRSGSGTFPSISLAPNFAYYLRPGTLGFQLFGLNPCVSHAYVRLVDFGKPVQLAGVEIRPGDLIHADKHGVCIIPPEIAPGLAEACREVERMERPLLE